MMHSDTPSIETSATSISSILRQIIDTANLLKDAGSEDASGMIKVAASQVYQVQQKLDGILSDVRLTRFFIVIHFRNIDVIIVLGDKSVEIFNLITFCWALLIFLHFNS